MSNQEPYQQPYVLQPGNLGGNAKPMHENPMFWVVAAHTAYVGGRSVARFGFLRTILAYAMVAFFFYLACLWFINHDGWVAIIGWFVILFLSWIPTAFVLEVGTKR